MAKKTYTESEIADLLGRAAQMQALEKTQGHEGLTLEELKAIAVETGIDPQFVEIASAASSNHQKAYGGIPVSTSRSMFVQGTLTDDSWSQMVARFVAEFGGPGEVTQTGARRTWTQGNVKITMEDVSGQVMMNATADWGKDLEMPVAFMIVGAIATLVTAGLAVVSMEWSIGLVAILVGMLGIGAFSSYQNKKAGQQEYLHQQFEAILNHCAVVMQGNEESLLPSGITTESLSEPKIDLSGSGFSGVENGLSSQEKSGPGRQIRGNS